MSSILNELSNNTLFISNVFVASISTYLCFRLGVNTLISWVSVQGVLANLFVLKQIELFGMHVTASDVFIISGMFSVLLLEEYHGKKVAKDAIIASCITLVFFSLVSQLHLAYTPSEHDFAQPAYQVLFGPNLRIILASIFAYWVSQQCNLKIFEISKKTTLPLSVRMAIALAIAQFIDTVVFAYLGLYGIVGNLQQIIVFSFTIKLITLLLLSSLSSFMKHERV